MDHRRDPVGEHGDFGQLAVGGAEETCEELCLLPIELELHQVNFLLALVADLIGTQCCGLMWVSLNVFQLLGRPCLFAF